MEKNLVIIQTKNKRFVITNTPTDSTLTSYFDLYKSNKLLPAYFGTDKNKFNGYLQKADIYALGITIKEIFYN